MFYNQHFWGECVWRGSCVVFAYFHGVNHPAMACYRIPVWSLTTELSKRLMVDSCQVGWQRLPTPLHRRPTESESSHQQILRAVHMFEKHGSRPLLCTALMCSLQWGVGPGLVSCCPFIAHHAETYRTGIWLALLGQSTDAIGPWSLVLLSGAECKGNCFGRWSVNRKILSRALWGRLGRVGKTALHTVMQDSSWHSRAWVLQNTWAADWGSFASSAFAYTILPCLSVFVPYVQWIENMAIGKAYILQNYICLFSGTQTESKHVFSCFAWRKERFT